jgi:hypothetical protein
MHEDILEELGTVAREHALVDSTEASEHESPPIDPRRRERMLEAVLGAPPPKPAERRRIPWVIGGLLAAAFALVVILPRDDGSTNSGESVVGANALPVYTVDVGGGIRLQRGDSGPVAFRAGQDIRLTVRPRRAVQEPLTLEIVGVHDHARHRLNWIITELEGGKGIYLVEGSAEDLRRIGEGEWALELAVVGGERLPGEPARVTILGDGE